MQNRKSPVSAWQERIGGFLHSLKTPNPTFQELQKICLFGLGLDVFPHLSGATQGQQPIGADTPEGVISPGHIRAMCPA